MSRGQLMTAANLCRVAVEFVKKKTGTANTPRLNVTPTNILAGRWSDFLV